jgi:Zn-dependent protease
MEFSTVQKVILWIIPLIFAITVHEVAHGWVANKLGDPTARLKGRLTLNPLAHIDPIGTLLIPTLTLFLGGFMFGYAKPVPVNFGRLRNIRRSMVLVALAGPAANLVMALLWAIIAKIALPFSNAIFFMGISGISMNLALMILNLIPIPPLDGSRVVSSFLRGNASRYYNEIERYGFFILLALMALGVLSHIIMPALNYLFYLIANLFGLSS